MSISSTARLPSALATTGPLRTWSGDARRFLVVQFAMPAADNEATALMGVDHLGRCAGEDGPEPPVGQH
jgi:hypothetical protein